MIISTMLTSLLFFFCVLLTIIIRYFITGRSKIVLFITIAWLLLQMALSINGFYLHPDARFLLLVGPPLLFMLFMILTKKGKAMLQALDIKWSIFLSIVRIPVEIVLYCLYLDKSIPVIMTFEGGNLDILSGISAIVVWWLYKQKKIGRAGLIIWNTACLLLLINIIIRAVLSMPSPVQQFAFNQPDLALLQFPYVWLPCFIVPAVLLSHITIFIRRSK